MTALLGLVLLLAPRPAAAASFAGADPLEFLFLDAGARQAALGGAFGAGRNDPDALRYNPAALGGVERSAFSYTRGDLFAGAEHTRLSLALRGGLGAAYDSVDFGAIRRSTLANPDGTGLGELSPGAKALTAGYGFAPAEDWAAGGALRWFREDLVDASASGWAADLGAQAVLLKEPSVLVGLAVQNAGASVRYQSQPEALPLNIKLGAAAGFPALGVPVALILDIDQVARQKLIVHGGIEAVFLDRLAVRTGFDRRNDAGLGLRFGFGLRLGGLSVDYAQVPYGDLGSSSLLTLGWRWGP